MIGILVKLELCIPLKSSFQSLSVHVLNVAFTVSYGSKKIAQSQLMNELEEIRCLSYAKFQYISYVQQNGHLEYRQLIVAA